MLAKREAKRFQTGTHFDCGTDGRNKLCMVIHIIVVPDYGQPFQFVQIASKANECIAKIFQFVNQIADFGEIFRYPCEVTDRYVHFFEVQEQPRNIR